MINVDAVDIRKCRSVEVIRFFWRLVYIQGLIYSLTLTGCKLQKRAVKYTFNHTISVFISK